MSDTRWDVAMGADEACVAVERAFGRMGWAGTGATGAGGIAAAHAPTQPVATTSMDFFRFRPFWRALLLFAAVFGGAAFALAQTSESKAERDLRELVERQRALLARAAEAEHQVDIEDLRPRLQALVFDYEAYLRDYPKVVEGYISYAMLLGNPLIDERVRASALLLKANEMDPNRALIKNQLGKYLAEDGRPLEALNYFLAAVQLEPQEPLYHYQIGQLLSAAREDFVKSGEWTPEQIEKAMRDALDRARTLAPDNVMYAYRYAESFYDLEEPQWEEALQTWRALEDRMRSPLEKQTIRLHIANVLVKMDQPEEARRVLESVEEPVLQSQKQKIEETLARRE